MPAPDLTDAQAVARVLDGDRDAFRVLADRHYARCLRYARRALGNRLDAEDAVQETFLRAYDALGRYEERQRFTAWLFRILVNECRAAAARRGRRDGPLAPDDDAIEQAAAPPAPDAGWRDAVERAVATLEPLLREAFLLRYVEDLGYAEMQAITGAGASALKMRVKRACDALRARLEEEPSNV